MSVRLEKVKVGRWDKARLGLTLYGVKSARQGWTSFKKPYAPSTAAITTLSMAVSVAVVTLAITKNQQANMHPYVLNVYLALFGPACLLCESREAFPKVITSCFCVPCFTFKVLKMT